MLPQIKNCFVGCLKATAVPAFAAPLVYAITSWSSFEIFDFFLSIPVGAWVGLQVLTVIGFPLLVVLSYLHLNRLWLVTFVGAIIGAFLGFAAPSQVWSIEMFFGFVGAVTGAAASHYSSPNIPLNQDAPPIGGAPVS